MYDYVGDIGWTTAHTNYGIHLHMRQPFQSKALERFMYFTYISTRRFGGYVLAQYIAY